MCVGRVVAWSFLYRAKYVTRLELVEGKNSKERKVFGKTSDFLSWFLILAKRRNFETLMLLELLL